MRNPFVYGDIATGDRFVGREAELASLQMDMASGQNVVIISPRRYGKTSLVFEAIERARRDGVLVAYLDLFRTPTKAVLADHLATAIYQGLTPAFERVRDKALELFTRLPIRPTIVLGPDGIPSMEFSTWTGQSRDADKTLERLLELPGEIARDRKRRVVLVMDEFQEVVEIDPHLPALMRAVFQVQPEVCHLFLGSRRHLMRRVFTNDNEPMYRLAKPMILGPIDPLAFSDYIRKRFEEARLVIEAETIQQILEISEGHPYVTLQICHVAWNMAATEGAPVTLASLSQILDTVLDTEVSRYSEVWDRLSPGQRVVLSAIASGVTSSLLAESTRRRHRLGPASSVQKALSRLVEADIVKVIRGNGYRMVDPLFRAWVSRISSPSIQPGPTGFAG